MWSRFRQVSFLKKYQVAAKCCKIIWFAANGIIWKLMRRLLSNLALSNGFSCKVDTKRNYQVVAISYSICCKKYYFAVFCNNLKIFVKEIFLNQFRIQNYLCIPSLESNWFNALKIISFAANNTFAAFCSNSIIFTVLLF